MSRARCLRLQASQHGLQLCIQLLVHSRRRFAHARTEARSVTGIINSVSVISTAILPIITSSSGSKARSSCRHVLAGMARELSCERRILPTQIHKLLVEKNSRESH